MTLLILFIARLFADHDDLCVFRPFSKYHLRRVLVQIATATGCRGSSQLR